MTKKHIIKLADHFKWLAETPFNHVEKEKVINSLVNFCIEQNPRFLETRFRNYINSVGSAHSNKCVGDSM